MVSRSIQLAIGALVTLAALAAFIAPDIVPIPYWSERTGNPIVLILAIIGVIGAIYISIRND